MEAAQSVAVLYQAWVFVSGDSKCSFRVVINRLIMLLSMSAVQTHAYCSFFLESLFLLANRIPHRILSDHMTIVPGQPRGRTVFWGASNAVEPAGQKR